MCTTTGCQYGGVYSGGSLVGDAETSPSQRTPFTEIPANFTEIPLSQRPQKKHETRQGEIDH